MEKEPGYMAVGFLGVRRKTSCCKKGGRARSYYKKTRKHSHTHTRTHMHMCTRMPI